MPDDGAGAAGAPAEDAGPAELDVDAVRPPAAAETVTIEEIFAIVDDETPARERSPTAEYGRPAMIFLAVAAPTPGSASRSFWEAVLRSTWPPVAPVFGAALEAAEALDGAVEEAPETVTRGEIFWMVAEETPDFERSPTEA